MPQRRCLKIKTEYNKAHYLCLLSVQGEFGQPKLFSAGQSVFSPGLILQQIKPSEDACGWLLGQVSKKKSIWDSETTLDFLTFFEKNLKKPSYRAQKVGPYKSVGVRNRRQRIANIGPFGDDF